MQSTKAFTTTALESVAPSDDGANLIVTFVTPTEPLSIAVPATELTGLVALLTQAQTQIAAIKGNINDQHALEVADAEVYHDQDGLFVHLRLVDGLVLPIWLGLHGAADLRDRLAASLAGGASSPPGMTRQ